jgi:hypothetical protein
MPWAPEHDAKLGHFKRLQEHKKLYFVVIGVCRIFLNETQGQRLF